jgi:hypothetical protein
MEPISTIALLASLALPATALPNWSSEKTAKPQQIVTSVISKDIYSEDAAIESTIADLMMQDDEQTPVVNITNDVLSQLDSYSKLEPGWDGPDSVTPSLDDIELAKNFVTSIPAVFPLPKAMLSSDGIIGLYWDDTVIYTDIQLESDGTLSIFSRDRSSGKEKFIDAIDLATISSNWFFDTLAELLSPEGSALPA